MLFYLRAFKKAFISEQRAISSPLTPLESSGSTSKEKVCSHAGLVLSLLECDQPRLP